jgi:ubiquinone/menaquinone biosynthesis C-methylase UbiE
MVHTPDPTEALPPGAGHSSFDLIEPERLLGELGLKPDSILLDAGCGVGNYSLALAAALGKHGLIYALDMWRPGLEALEKRAAAAGRKNLRPLQADISKTVPLPNASIDLCLMATVLHDLAEYGTAAGALREVHRVLKPGGVLAVVEFDKVEGPPGPPMRIRLAPEEVEKLVAPYGFQMTGTARVGPYNYLMKFIKTGI